MKKRVFAAAMIAAIIICLTGCGEVGQTPSVTPAAAQPTDLTWSNKRIIAFPDALNHTDALCLAEGVNETSNTIRVSNIEIHILDDNDQVICVNLLGQIRPTVVNPGEKIYLAGLISDELIEDLPPERLNNFIFYYQYRIVGTRADIPATIEDVKIGEKYGHLRFIGTVKNQGNSIIDHACVFAPIFQDGEYIGLADALVSVRPNDTKAFEIIEMKSPSWADPSLVTADFSIVEWR